MQFTFRNHPIQFPPWSYMKSCVSSTALQVQVMRIVKRNSFTDSTSIMLNVTESAQQNLHRKSDITENLQEVR